MLTLLAHVTPAEYPAGLALLLGGFGLGVGFGLGYGLYLKFIKSR